MHIYLKQNESFSIDQKVNIETFKNTIGIIDLNDCYVKGTIILNAHTISYNLSVNVEVKYYDENDFCDKDMNLNFNIDENLDILEEFYLTEAKTLDFNGKLWENIVVEVLSELSTYNMNSVEASNTLEEDNVDEVDERLKPLLNLLK